MPSPTLSLLKPEAATVPTPVTGDDETLNALGESGLRIIQPKHGFRFSLDPLLLTAFTRLKPGEKAIDLGTGTGVIPLLLAQRHPRTDLVGIELHAEAADRARRSVALNQLEERIKIIQGDLRDCRTPGMNQAFDVVVTNPPYRRLATGRIAPEAHRAVSRHELHGALEDFLDSARYLLKSGGRFYMIYLPERLPELLALMCMKRIEPKRLRCIHSRDHEAACLVLVEGRRDGRPGLTIEPPLRIYQGDEYSAELCDMAGFKKSCSDGRA